MSIITLLVSALISKQAALQDFEAYLLGISH